MTRSCTFQVKFEQFQVIWMNLGTLKKRENQTVTHVSKRYDVFWTKYSRMDQKKFAEDSL